MEKTSVRPQNDNAIEGKDLLDRVRQLETKLAATEAELHWFKEQYRLAAARRYGASSEKRPHPEQINLFDEVEREAEALAPEPTLEETVVRRKGKRRGKRKEDLSQLPVETIEYRLDLDDQVCSCCGGQLHTMSQQVRRELHVEPARAKVVEHVQMVYSCRSCEKTSDGTESFVKTAPRPKPVIPNSIASPSAVAYIIDQKYNMSVPLNRQEQHWKSLGINIPRKNMANWVIYAADRWLAPFYQELKKELLQRDIIQADETTVRVLREPERKPGAKSYMWLYRSGRDGPPIVLFEYQPSRASHHPKAFLHGFSGFLQTDGYAVYNKVENVEHIGCLAHARRYFDESIKALDSAESRLKSMSQKGLDFCSQIFHLESKWSALTPEDRHKQRQEHSKPVLEAFLAWLQTMHDSALPKSKFGKAVNYCLNQWDSLCNFLLDGRLEVHNNRSEQSIKAFVVGRKNWMFATSSAGARASALVYSVVQTAKENDLNVRSYISYLLEKLPNIDLQDSEAFQHLLPWSDTLPAHVRLHR